MLDVLIVEDDESSREALALWFQKQDLKCRCVGSLRESRVALDEQMPDLVLLDLQLTDGTGLDLLSELGAAQRTEVVMISGRTTVNAAIDALRLGAHDFLTKPLDLVRLKAIVQGLEKSAELRREVFTLRDELKKLGRFGHMVGSSPAMQEIYTLIERVAPTSETVVITGATGTGKEVAAATIHKLSRRASKPFVAINCGAVSPNLIESEFFGHERGAFTGANRQHKGVFERAHGGTLFLDEVTEMSPDLQVKLLRVLETSRVMRVGGDVEIDVDVRIIAATNRDPHEAVRDEVLRQDLLYRLLVFPIQLPSLASRNGDVLLLARAFLDELNAEHETTKSLRPEAEAKLTSHDWPGNVRELQNIIRRCYILADMHIGPEDLPFDFDTQALPEVPAPTKAGTALIAPGMSIAQAEQRLIEITLTAVDGDKKRAADMLGISIKTLYGRLKTYEAVREGI